MTRFKPQAFIFAVAAFVAVAAGAFGEPTLKTLVPVTTHTAAAPQLRAPAPIATSNTMGKGFYVGSVAAGTVVPLARLPRLPVKTANITVRPQTIHRIHRMSATGAYIDVSGTTCAGGSLGYDFTVGCTVTWRSDDLNEDGLPTGDTKQDYYIVSTNANETSGSATAAGNAYTTTNPGTHNTTFNTAGTYILGTYDVTAGQWVDVVYVNVGSVFTIKVYSDPYHTEETYQFTAGNSNDAYIYLQNVPQGDYYVVAINQTGVSPNCVFMAPAPQPSPYTYPANQLCNLTLSAGLQASGGNLSVTWPLSSSDPAGNYSVEVYDVTQGVRLGQVQVSLTGASGIVLTTYPGDSGPNVNPSPAAPVAGATPSTILDYDGGPNPGPADESVTGIRASVNGVGNGSYRWTLTDPMGQVVGQNTETITGNTGSQTFTFDNLPNGPTGYILPPGRYPAKSWVMQLYNTTTNTVAASQGFQILGYSTLTQFENVGGTGGLVSSMTLTQQSGNPTLAGTAGGLRITNESSVVFNGMGDNLNNLMFTTGPDFNVSATTGYGIFVSTSATALCNTTCTTTGTDSNGNTWNVTITCSGATLTAKGECNVQMTPSSTSIFLAPGAYVEVDGLYWYEFTGASCGDACEGSTSEFPQHGLHWSCIQSVGNCANNDLASTPVYFDNSGASGSGTAYVRIVGALDNGTYYNAQEPAPAVPFTNAHLFQSYFPQAAYNFSSPYALAVGKDWDTIDIPIDNTGTQGIYEIAIVLPSIMHDQGEYSWLTGNGDWTETTCPTTFKAATSCFIPPASLRNEVAAGTTSDLYYYQSWPLQSFPFTELQVFGCTGSANACTGGTGNWFQLTAASGEGETTPDKLYTVDGLAVAGYSINASDMTASFDPSTIGNGSTATLGAVFQNTSTANDPMPDSVDILVLETDGTGYNFTGTPTISAPGWSFIGGPFKNNGGGLQQLWFGLCTNQYTTLANTGNYGGPPTSPGAVGYPLNARYPAAPNPSTCGTESDALAPGATATISNITVTNFNNTGSLTWHMYAHGINGGGWSAAIPMTLNVAAVSANVWFNKINGATIATNSVPTIGGSPNYYQYAIENTSKANSDVTSVAVTLPGTDINGENATDGSGNYWEIPNIDTAGTIWLGSTATNATSTSKPYGCTVSTTASGATGTYNPTSAGANGQIYISGCTSFAPGDTLYVDLPGAPSAAADVTNPQEENDSYLFPAVVNGTTAAGTAWAGSNEITEQFSLGLDIVVDPSNPGPGGSKPVETCGSNTCAFSGSTLDVGNLSGGTAGQFYTFQDVVRTSIYYSGGSSSGHSLDLYVEAEGNPTSNDGTHTTIGTVLPAGAAGAPAAWPANQLLTMIDTAASTSGSVTAVGSSGTTYQVIPSSPGLELATVPETNSSTPYDIIDDFGIAMGIDDSTSTQTVVVTYTVVPN